MQKFWYVYVTAAVCYENEMNLHIFALEKNSKLQCGDVSLMCFMEFGLKITKTYKEKNSHPPENIQWHTASIFYKINFSSF